MSEHPQAAEASSAVVVNLSRLHIPLAIGGHCLNYLSDAILSLMTAFHPFRTLGWAVQSPKLEAAGDGVKTAHRAGAVSARPGDFEAASLIKPPLQVQVSRVEPGHSAQVLVVLNRENSSRKLNQLLGPQAL